MHRASWLTGAIVLCTAACSGNGTPESKSAAAESKAIPTRVDAGQSLVDRGASAATFDPREVKPYFSEGPAGAGVKHMSLERWKQARASLLAAEKIEKDPSTAARLSLLIAVSEAALKKFRSAGARFAKVAVDHPVVSNYANLRGAEMYLAAGQDDRALSLAEMVSASSVHKSEALLVRGDALRGARRWKEAAQLYDDYLANDPSDFRLGEARYRRAEAWEKIGKPRLEVGLLYKEVTTKAVLSGWGVRATERTKAIARKLPRAARAKLLELNAEERIHRGETYYRNHRNKLSLAEFTAALSAPGLDAEKKCVAAFSRANSVYKQRDRKRAAPLFEDAIKACNASTNKDLQVKSAYQAGRSYGLTSRSETAIARYLSIELKHPTHSYADDARLRAAEEYRDLNNQKKVTELLSSIPSKYPQGDMRAEAMWRLAWRAYKKKNFDAAIKWLKQQIKVKPIDENYWAEGQAQYWLGRAYGELGKSKEEMASYQDAVILYPLSYYAFLALNRIREKDAKLFATLTEKIAEPPADFDAAKPAFEFKPRAEYATNEFKSAVELLRLGLGRAAQSQLSALGFVVPAGKKVVSDADEIDRIWAMAFLNHNAGRFGRSHWVTRWHVVDFKRRWPVGHNKARWRIAYPIAWWELLSKHAKINGYPPELSIAFVREESAFNPLQESFANAIGLTQMIAPTAKRFAKGTGIVVSRQALRDPEKNVTIGSRFLKFLYDRFSGGVALVVPSYNAGEGATDRWLRYRGDWAQDEWAEEVPYDETRNYSKRVLATYFAYNYLGSGKIPVMPNVIPATAVKQAKR